ncbi:helix-turn-helix domain-containing protein [Brevundimonas diminuta]|uniref:helix-turn-helix domain-containing protein n=1 Tax=Brevundimonas diminuta TaxID=293 RepID=UPI0025A68338|nr:helix-turn-helix domain-containing protein [Brevundimonas diminuta]MDM8352883.1 helix-turn-helix domain-containing protein [Brevundimonas diminuta]
MSIALMTEVWRLDLPPSDKMVLLALADAANDDGVTWMALESKEGVKLDLIKKTSLSRRAIQGALKRLCDAGYLSRVDRPGKGVIWTVKGCTSCAPQEMRPAADAPGGAAGAPKPSTNPHTSSEGKPSSEDARPTSFDVFWKAYPAKTGKGAARRAFEAAARKIRKDGGDPLGVMLAALERAVASARWNDQTYTKPNPATWLSQERWEDDYGPPADGRSRQTSTVAPAAMSPELQARRRALLEAADA